MLTPPLLKKLVSEGVSRGSKVLARLLTAAVFTATDPRILGACSRLLEKRVLKLDSRAVWNVFREGSTALRDYLGGHPCAGWLSPAVFSRIFASCLKRGRNDPALMRKLALALRVFLGRNPDLSGPYAASIRAFRRSGDRDTRLHGVSLSGRLHPFTAQTRKVLWSALSGRDPGVRLAALASLERLASKGVTLDRSLLDRIRRCARSRNPHVRKCSALILAHTGTPGR